MNDEAVCRTAPATPGVSKNSVIKIVYAVFFVFSYSPVVAGDVL